MLTNRILKTFEELGVAAPILKAIQEMGYESPMPVQEEVIPFLLGEDNDVIALAQTGTGKTAAYGLPILQKINVSQYQPQALILCPTRELCLQIADDLNDYSKYIDNLNVLLEKKMGLNPEDYLPLSQENEKKKEKWHLQQKL